MVPEELESGSASCVLAFPGQSITISNAFIVQGDAQAGITSNTSPSITVEVKNAIGTRVMVLIDGKVVRKLSPGRVLRQVIINGLSEGEHTLVVRVDGKPVLRESFTS